MALLLSDAFFPGLAPLRLRRRRDPFDELFEELHSMHSHVSRKDGDFSVSFKTSEFAPEELEVNVVGDSIVVEGKHSSESETGSIKRHFCQKMLIPSDVDPESIQSALDSNGNLSVSAKIKKPSVEDGKRNIPIGMTANKQEHNVFNDD
ncbi:hypothetical protein QR680_010803 [Steinernema hermaphroditum]|uniref:SHSP domain-containing protein n=1 Tax=Steinernema hermaphroditum TaxID=289476 RepID=A0AA39MC55_9BILA|nr:hypothetical protein QR680_010803 [Steinernema hermaphroditum]